MVMFTWLMLACAVIVMYKAAEMDGENGLVWGGVTFGACLACTYLIPWPLLNVFIGFIACFMAMFAVKMIKR